MSTSLPGPVQAAFENAKHEFLNSLKNPQSYNFDRFKSIDDVYDFTDQMQRRQNEDCNMRYLRRIKPYLDNLSQFVSVLDTFSQVKADVASLIWGPVKFLLQISSTVVKSYDKIIDAMGQIGDRLPQFKKYLELFRSNDTLKSLLAVFFRDILDFHVTALNFFQSRKWDLFFEAMWPKCGNKVNIIMANIERHTNMITGEVTIASINDAQEAHKAALAKNERDVLWQQRHDMDTLQQMLSPFVFEERIRKLQRTARLDSGKWLDTCHPFTTWLNGSGLADKLLWVEGIPGAGKTVLASIITDRCRNMPGFITACGFISYNDDSMTCVRILQSFSFQIVDEFPNLRSALLSEVERVQKRVLSTISFNVGLLVKLINLSGPMFLVIDGLDELAGEEQYDLLQVLLKLLSDCDEIKLLISSRSDDRIDRMLRQKALVLKIHEWNQEDIKIYVSDTSKCWLDSAGFDTKTSTKIKKLLDPLATKSEGMMLYAKLVLSSLEYSTSLDEIENELKSLPDGLDQAYGRILKHVTERLPNRAREKVQRILGWISVAQTPLRLPELEYALSIQWKATHIETEKRNSFNNIADWCGPIIEIEDEYIRFVHFTAREYLADPQSGPYIDQVQIQLDVSRVCITYLSFSCIHAEDSAMIRDYILSGDYVLLNYAATRWIKHVQNYMREPLGPDDDQPFLDRLEQFVRESNISPSAPLSNYRSPDSHHSSSLETQWTDLNKVLKSEEAFWLHNVPLIDLRKYSTEDKEIDVPPSIFWAYTRVFRAMQSMLCTGHTHQDECYCSRLHELYGNRLHKCSFTACQWHRQGFQTYKESSNHVRGHVRPFKCTDTGCQFYNIGFKDEADLCKHKDICHPEANSDEPKSQPGEPDLEEDVLEAVIRNAIEENNVDRVSRLLFQASQRLTLDMYARAVAWSTPQMVQAFINDTISVDIQIHRPRWSGKPTESRFAPFMVAVMDQNFEVIEFFLTNHKKQCFMDKACRLAVSREPQACLRILGILLRHNLSYAGPSVNISLAIQSEEQDAECFIQIHKTLKNAKIAMRNIGGCFPRLARRNCSIAIAQYVLSQGGNVDFNENQRPALFVACQRTTREAALFVKFLLENGANPNLSYNGRYPSEQDGAKMIHRWLGMTWDELVESTAHDRSQKWSTVNTISVKQD